MNRFRILAPLLLFFFLSGYGCSPTPQKSAEKPIVLQDRDEAGMICRYLNEGEEDPSLMKSIFYDLHLIRVLYSDQIPCLNWSRFIPPDELPVRKPEFSRQLDRCMIYPRRIDGGISYLFEDQWNNKEGQTNILYYYFECSDGEVELVGSYDTYYRRWPQWWTEADNNLRLYQSRR